MALVASVAAGCATGPDPVVVDEATTFDAVAESFAGSWSWSGRLDVELTDRQIGDIVELQAGDEFGADPDAAEAQLRLALDEFDRNRMHGALGEDQSFRGSWERDGTDLFDVRADLGEVLRAESLTPSARLLFAADVPGILAWWRDLSAFDDSIDPDEVWTVDEVRRQAVQALQNTDPDLLRVLLAVIDGGFGGFVGELDFADLGVTEEQLAQLRDGFAEQAIGVADADTFTQLAADALTVRDIVHGDGMTTAVVDIHPRAAAEAVYDLFDDAQGIAEDLADDYLLDEELPDTIEEVATLTFTADGDLVEVRTDVLSVAGQLAGPLELGQDEVRLLGALAGARFHVVFEFGDHDEVATTVAVDAVTLEWDWIVEFFAPMVSDALQ